MRRRLLLTLGAVALLIVGLAWFKLRERRIEPKAPAAVVTTNLPSVPLSEIQIPIEVNIAPLADAIDSKIPRTLKEDTLSGGYSYGAYKSPESVKVAISGEHLQVDLPISYVLTTPWYLNNCGTASSPERATVAIDIPISLLKWDFVLADANNAKFNIDPWYACKFILGTVNVDSLISVVANSAVQDFVGHDFNKLLPDPEQFQTAARTAWQALQEPIQLAPDIWLLLQPRSIEVSPLSGSGHLAKVALGITAKPELRLSVNKPSIEPSPFPLPEKHEIGNSFHIVLLARLPYESATTIVRKKLVGQRYEFEIPGFGRRTFTIVDAAIYGSSDLAVVKLSFTGPIRSTIYFWGKPQYSLDTSDSQLDHFTISDINYTPETNRALLKIGSVLLHSFLQSQLQKQVQEACTRFSVEKPIGELKRAVEQGLNRNITPDISIAGSLKKFTSGGVLMTSDAFIATAELSGTLEVSAIAPRQPPLDVRTQNMQSFMCYYKKVPNSFFVGPSTDPIQNMTLKASIARAIPSDCSVPTDGYLSGGDSEWNGTKGRSVSLTGLSITFDPAVPNLGVEYMGHFQNSGDTGWKSDGDRLENGGNRLEGVAIRLTGPLKSHYTVTYSCHVEGQGDIGPVSDGAFCGTKGQGKRLEAVRITVTRLTAPSS